MIRTVNKQTQKKAISDIIYDKLYSQIITGKLLPGERITELQIAQDEGVSQAPVREALKRLSEARLVKLVPRSGCYICKITKEEAEYLFEIRNRLEVLAMEYAFDRLDRADLEKLKKEMLECEKMSAKSFVSRAVNLDAKFHLMIAEHSGSEDLEILIDKLRARIQLLRVREASSVEAAQNSFKAHMKIIDAIIAGDRQGAIDSLAEHITQTRENVLANYIWE